VAESVINCVGRSGGVLGVLVVGYSGSLLLMKWRKCWLFGGGIKKCKGDESTTVRYVSVICSACDESIMVR